jgi:uncharacterized protein YbjQ (UPF0145 family)
MGELVVYIVVLLGLLLLGFFVGSMNERAHFSRLSRAEKRLGHIRVCNLKRVTDPDSVVASEMVMGQVVIATDYFKSFATSLRNLVGGEAHAARKLLIRARREAVVRLLEKAHRRGATEIWNVRFGFCNVSMMRGRGGAMQVEMLAWGTAVRRA